MAESVLLTLLVLAGVPAVQVGYAAGIEALLDRLPQRGQGALRPWLWLLPALVLIGLFLVYPAVMTVILSLRDAGGQRFVGLANYAFAVTNPAMRIAFRNNIVWLLFFTGFTVALGLLLAVLTDRVRYESAAKTVLFLPMAISFVAAAVIWKFVFEYRPSGAAQIGLLNALVTAVDRGAQPVAWLIHRGVNTFALIAVAVWVWVGFCLVVLSAALKAIPAELLEAARVDGATEWHLFRRVLLPLLLPTVTVVATTMLIFALKAFDIVYVMTSGNFGTDVIAHRMYTELFSVRHFGRAAALAVILFAATVPVMVLNIRRFREQEALR